MKGSASKATSDKNKYGFFDQYVWRQYDVVIENMYNRNLLEQKIAFCWKLVEILPFISADGVRSLGPLSGIVRRGEKEKGVVPGNTSSLPRRRGRFATSFYSDYHGNARDQHV